MPSTLPEICDIKYHFLSQDIADPYTSTRTVRARALEIIGPHENEDSEGVSIFHIERKNQETNCYKAGMVQYF